MQADKTAQGWKIQQRRYLRRNFSSIECPWVRKIPRWIHWKPLHREASSNSSSVRLQFWYSLKTLNGRISIIRLTTALRVKTIRLQPNTRGNNLAPLHCLGLSHTYTNTTLMLQGYKSHKTILNWSWGPPISFCVTPSRTEGREVPEL